jgi:hypothetical protein
VVIRLGIPKPTLMHDGCILFFLKTGEIAYIQKMHQNWRQNFDCFINVQWIHEGIVFPIT